MSHELVQHVRQYVDVARNAGNNNGVMFLEAIQRQVEVGVELNLVPTLPAGKVESGGGIDLPTPSLGIELTEEETGIVTPLIVRIRDSERELSFSTFDLVALLPGLTKDNLYAWERSEFIHPGHTGVEDIKSRKYRIYQSQDTLLISFLWVFSCRRHLQKKTAIELARDALGQMLASKNEQPNEQDSSAVLAAASSPHIEIELPAGI